MLPIRRVLWVLTGLLVLMPPIASAGKQQALVISAGGVAEKGMASLEENPSLRDFRARVNVSQASALLTWMQQLYRRRSAEKSPIAIRLETGQKFEFLEPMITNVVVSGARDVVVEIKHRDGMLMLTVPKAAWDGAGPPPNK